MSKHTPGPWKREHSGYANAPFVVFTGEVPPKWNSRYPLTGVNWIAEIRCDESEQHEEHCANVHLIAAAPVLLKALEELLPYLPDRNDALNYAATNEGRVGDIHVAVSRACDAIRSAKGER